MNYRHIYHAGNFADVVKHAVLARIIEYLKKKDAAFRVIDTHAGRGVYDLSSAEAQKTGEWRDGIGRLMDASLPQAAAELLEPYLETVRALNPKGGVSRYPGSPAITRHLLRKQDRLSAIELHPVDAKALGAKFAGDIQTRVINLDGWLALGAHIPPKERRGVVLVDPPFEEAGEFDRMIQGLIKAHKRWPSGLYAFWYPIKDRRAVNAFRSDLKETGIARITDIVFEVRPPSSEPRLDGCGVTVVNLPYGLDREVGIILSALRSVLSEGSSGRFSITALSGEDAAA
ncbi:MAG: 23S rRNA (adenine(2030)-N(6))-methyltransferase RlmJ [Rhizobiaceae bacterium]|nr:23S rRNA (adenine(2030)-N(6))-methyltransferase RlmJ [Rhizobiaceae bacterium]